MFFRVIGLCCGFVFLNCFWFMFCLVGCFSVFFLLVYCFDFDGVDIWVGLFCFNWFSVWFLVGFLFLFVVWLCFSVCLIDCLWFIEFCLFWKWVFLSGVICFGLIVCFMVLVFFVCVMGFMVFLLLWCFDVFIVLMCLLDKCCVCDIFVCLYCEGVLWIIWVE